MKNKNGYVEIDWLIVVIICFTICTIFSYYFKYDIEKQQIQVQLTEKQIELEKLQHKPIILEKLKDK